MKPTPQVLAARRLLENRDKGFTFRLFYRRSLRGYLIQLVTTAAVIALLGYLKIWPAAWIYLGVTIGSFARDIAWVRSIRKSWPLSVALTDWEKVRKLADGQPLDSPP